MHARVEVYRVRSAGGCCAEVLVLLLHGYSHDELVVEGISVMKRWGRGVVCNEDGEHQREEQPASHTNILNRAKLSRLPYYANLEYLTLFQAKKCQSNSEHKSTLF